MENLNILETETLVLMIRDLDWKLGVALEQLDSHIEQLGIKDREATQWKERFRALKDNVVLGMPVAESVVKGELDGVVTTDLAKEVPEIQEVKVARTKPFRIRRAGTGTQGNLTGSKHSGHKCKGDEIYAMFPNGDIMSFETVEECKEEVRSRIPQFANSTLTNISKAARNNGSYYGCNFTYDIGIVAEWIEERDEMDE